MQSQHKQPSNKAALQWCLSYVGVGQHEEKICVTRVTQAVGPHTRAAGFLHIQCAALII